MSYSKEQRIVNQMHGSTKNQRSVPAHQPNNNEIMPGMEIPNYSGDHSKGSVRTTPTLNQDIVNKKYVDDSIDTLKTNLSINFFIDGGGAEIATGIKGWLKVDFACTIQSATLLADQSGSIVIDVWKDTYANYPPTDADSITAAAVPTITAATKSYDATLTGWTRTINAGDILYFNVDSVTTIEACLIALNVTRD